MLDRNRLRRIDRRVVPNKVPGTMFSRKSGDEQADFDEYSLPRMQFKRLTKEDAIAYGVSLANRYRVVQVFRAALDEAGAPEPKTSDRFAATEGDDAGIVWQVEQIDKVLMGNAFDCLAQQLVGT